MIAFIFDIYRDLSNNKLDKLPHEFFDLGNWLKYFQVNFSTLNN